MTFKQQLLKYTRTPCRGLALCLLGTQLILTGCAESEPEKQPEAEATARSFTDWMNEQYEIELGFSPVQLTFQGRSERNDEIDALTIENMQEELTWKLASAAQMESLFDYDALTDSERLSYDLWLFQAEQMRQSADFFYDGLIFDQMNGLQGFLPTFLINFHSVKSEDDMRAYIARIRAVAPRVSEALANAQKASAQGVISPLFALEGVITQSQAVITGQPFDDQADQDSDLWADIQSEIDKLQTDGLIDDKQSASLLSAAKDALVTHFQPAYENIITWAENEKDRTPDVVTGVGAQPNGAAYYEYRLRNQTTLDLTADQIHQIGLDEVARLRLEMEAIMEQAGFTGELSDFFEHVRNAEWNYFPNTDEGRQAYITDAKAAIDNIQDKLPDFFGLLPKAGLEVRRVEPFRERDGGAQHYYPGTPDGSRSGVYYAHLSDMGAMPKNQLEVIAYHEGLPGHHMQISIAQELEDVATFRTQARFTAYTEGWALYSEYLAKEIPGTYQDPYQDFGRLSASIWRAIRLVVDTGLHARGWTEQDAIDYFAANSPEPLESIRSEVRRYIVMPGQATSYKIGMLKILELRDIAEKTLGDNFDLRDFHDAILGGGALPLKLLEKRVLDWVDSTSGRPTP